MLCAADAIRVFRLALTLPPQPETLAFVLDDRGVGGVITLVSGTTDPDAVLAVTECLARAAQEVPRAVALVIATVRPLGGVVPGDVDRWLEASHLAAQCGIMLLEWFVIGSMGVTCPRDLLGEPERWGHTAAQVARRRSAG
ncbi:MAG: hypothetical protein WCI22_18520 [Actinomycetota bacterium]